MYYEKIRTIEDMKNINWREFEKFIEYSLIKKGYNAKVRKGIKDGGIDLDASYKGEIYLIQCKKWDKYYVGVKELREFYGVIKSENENAKGIYVTTSFLSKEATKFAIKNNIEVWNKTNLLSKLNLNSNFYTNNFEINRHKRIFIFLFIIILLFIFLYTAFNLGNKVKEIQLNNNINKITLPKNILLNKYSKIGKNCNLGYEKINNICKKIKIPKNSTFESKFNGYLKWKCNYGYIKSKNQCVKVIFPKHATLDPYKGTYWNCNKGYRRVGNKCDFIILPDNAHLTSYPTIPWLCDTGYKQKLDKCIIK